MFGLTEINYDRIAKKIEKKSSDLRLRDFYAELTMVSPTFLPRISKLIEQSSSAERKLGAHSLCLGDLKSLTMNFYQELNSAYPEQILSILNSPNTFLRESEPTQSTGKNFVAQLGIMWLIELHPSTNLSGVLTLPHEYCHLLEQRIQEQKLPKEECIGEIATMFIEKIFIDYLENHKVISSKNCQTLRDALKTTLIDDAKIIVEESFVFNSFKQPIDGLQLKDFAENLSDEKKAKFINRIKKMSNSRAENGAVQMRYVIGGLVSEEMYYEYLKNPKDTLEKFDFFLKHNAEMSVKDSFKLLCGDEYATKLGFDLKTESFHKSDKENIVLSN